MSVRVDYQDALRYLARARRVAFKLRRIIRDQTGRAWLLDWFPLEDHYHAETELSRDSRGAIQKVPLPEWATHELTGDEAGYTRHYARPRNERLLQRLFDYAAEHGSTARYVYKKVARPGAQTNKADAQPYPQQSLAAPASVAYRPADGANACRSCEFFRGEAKSCARVYGPIFGNMVCNLYMTATPVVRKAQLAKNNERNTLPALPAGDDTATRYTSSPANPSVSMLNSDELDSDPEIKKFSPGVGLSQDNTPTHTAREFHAALKADLGQLDKDAQITVNPSLTTPNPRMTRAPRSRPQPRGTLRSAATTAHEAMVSKADHSDSAMLAWFPASGQAQQLSIPNGEPPDQLHVTIIYLGKAADIPDDKWDAIQDIIEAHVLRQPPLTGEISSVTTFPPSKGSDNKHVLVALVDVPGLSRFRARLVDDLEHKLGVKVPDDHDFHAHLTLDTNATPGGPLLASPIKTTETTPVAISRLHLVVGNATRRVFDLDRGVGQITGLPPSQLPAILSDTDRKREYAQALQ